ncbi:MAG: hypothetical protein FH761_19220 [Firmicutes bacterium]|nr:hypothetical protein [Bacillota bacterium]
MQLVSNILLNLILLYPIIIVREYCVNDLRKVQQKKLVKIAIYLFMTNILIIDTAYYIEEYLFFYVVILIPAGIVKSITLMKENCIEITLVNETHVIGIKYKKFIVLLLVFSFLITSLMLANYQVNDKVLKIHGNNLEKLRTSENPIKELIYQAQNPRTLLSEWEYLIKINENKYKVIYSGNSKKIVRGTIKKENVIYTYDLTYRRIDNRWKLDGLYSTSEVHR